jgi:heme exporter protein C
MNIAQRLAGAETGDVRSHNHLGWLKVLTGLAAAGIALGIYMALVYAGTDTGQGNVQRIFYFHVPAFMGAFIAFTCTVIGGIAYLRTRNPRWDFLALAGVEVGFMLSIITLATGMVWARPIWNTWWTWDPRLTSAAIMTLTYAAYLMLRGAVENPDKQRTFAAIYGIFAISTVIFTFMIIRIRPDTIHPTVMGPSAGNAQGGFAMTGGMRAALMVNMFVWVALVTPALLWWRIRLENALEHLRVQRAQLSEG